LLTKKNEKPIESFFKAEEAKKPKAKKGRTFVPIEKYESDSKIKIKNLLERHDNSNCMVER
jgi:hypothetical protein